MPTINAPERVTQNHVIRFFSDKLHYTYLGDLHDRENSKKGSCLKIYLETIPQQEDGILK